MPDAHRDAERTTRVAGGRLHKYLVERAFAQDAAVSHAVQGHAAGEAEVAHAGFLVREGDHLEHHLLGDVLDRSRQVHFALGQLAFGLPRSTQ